MLKTLCFIALFVSANVFAQRLYVHDLKDGNYRSYEAGGKIVLFMLDSSQATHGTIAKLDSSGFYLKDGTYVRLNQIASIIPPDKAKSIVRVLAVIGGVLLMVGGTINFIAGASGLKEEPVLGAAVMVGSVGMFAGGVWVMRHSKKVKKQIKQELIDNIHYSAFIE